MALNILVVDDSVVARGMVIKTLKMCGVGFKNLFEASDGFEALEIIGNNWIDLIVTDINMPRMNGEEMIDKIRGMPENALLPVIVVSAESAGERVNSIAKKCCGYIRKPFSAEKLRDAIVKLTGVTYESVKETSSQYFDTNF